jgi:hypothetical protein
MGVFWTTNVLDEIPQLLAQCRENLIFVFNRLCEGTNISTPNCLTPG